MVDTKNEIWKDVIFNNNYEVSNLGRVRSKARKVPCKHYYRYKKEHYLKPVDYHGYLRVGFITNGKLNNYAIHRLVMSAFVKDLPYPQWEIDHINGDSHDNRLENLEYVSSSENTIRAYNLGLQSKEVLSLANHSRKMTPTEIIDMKNQFLKEGRVWGNNNRDFITRYAKLYNMTVMGISNILANRTNRFFGEDIVQTTKKIHYYLDVKDIPPINNFKSKKDQLRAVANLMNLTLDQVTSCVWGRKKLSIEETVLYYNNKYNLQGNL